MQAMYRWLDLLGSVGVRVVMRVLGVGFAGCGALTWVVGAREDLYTNIPVVVDISQRV